jgi:hypothetical protein
MLLPDDASHLGCSFGQLDQLQLEQTGETAGAAPFQGPGQFLSVRREVGHLGHVARTLPVTSPG